MTKKRKNDLQKPIFYKGLKSCQIGKSGALDRNTPRTCTPEYADMATNGENSETQATLVADLAIDPVTREVDFSNSVPFDSYLANIVQVRENMQQLLDMILGFFEVEEQKVESGELKAEEMLIDVQELNTDTKRPTRLSPKSPYQRRAEDSIGDLTTD